MFLQSCYGIKRVVMKILHKIFSLREYDETHMVLCFLGFKLKYPKSEIAKRKKESPYYYYKKNNIDITTLPPAEGQVRDIQLANLVLLKELDYVCKKAGLRYWLDGGTLLGAVRHKGFVPWDDDIDTAMLREDYEQIIEAFEKYSRNPDIFVGHRDCPNKYNNYHLKVQHKKCPYLFVDIFPWDTYGKRLSIADQLEKTIEIKNMRDTIVKNLYGADELKIKLDALMKENILIEPKEDECDYVWGIDFNHVWKNWFTHYEVLHPMKTIEFEGIQFPCLNNPDAFLSRLYGDYMAYPNRIGLGHSMFLKFTEEEIAVLEELKKTLN